MYVNSAHVMWDNGRLPFDQNFRNFRNGDKWYLNFQGKDPENSEIVEFPKSEQFNRKFRKFRVENQMERKIPGKKIRKFGCTSGQVQTPYFTWAESNANEQNPLFSLICIRFGSCEVRRLNLASGGCPIFRKLCKFVIFYSALLLWQRSSRVGHLR